MNEFHDLTLCYHRAQGNSNPEVDKKAQFLLLFSIKTVFLSNIEEQRDDIFQKLDFLLRFGYAVTISA
ncbi:MAG: hypothetical protein E7445_01925 [Ruminococcaceae bacterium]|nr:hypothetical protein [Oscillospiraceae bacterium]